MKYFIAGIIILCLVLVLCTLNQRLETNWLTEIQLLLEETRRSIVIDDRDAALSLVETANDLWQKRSEYFSTVLVCDHVNELNHALSLALDSLYRGSDSAADSVTQALSLVETIISGEQLSLKNILAISCRR